MFNFICIDSSLVQGDETLEESFSEDEESDDDAFSEDAEFADAETSVEAKSPRKFVSMERKREIVNLAEKHPTWSWKTLKSKGAKELTDRNTLSRFKKQVSKNAESNELWRKIDEHVFERVLEARKEREERERREKKRLSDHLTCEYRLCKC